MTVYELPIKTVTGLNAREHWRVRHKRVSGERATTRLIVKTFTTPAIVRFTRISEKLCDDDNLQGAMKAIRDELAKIAGVDDGPSGPIRWEYAQEKCKRGTFGVRVEIVERADAAIVAREQRKVLPEHRLARGRGAAEIDSFSPPMNCCLKDTDEH